MKANEISAKAEQFYTDPGDPMHPIYTAKVLKDGSIDLKLSGFENLQDKIEAERASTELATLIARFENGDLTALRSREGFYGDILNVPRTIGEAMNVVLQAENEFDFLPVDIKKQFDSDWRKWLAAAGTKEWYDIMQQPQEKKVEEVKTDVSEQ